MGDSDGDGTPGRRGKVARLIDEYDLDGLGAEMERRWTTPDDDRMSLRDLADYFNQEVLASALADAGVQPLAGEVENMYHLLTGDDVSGADHTRTRRRLDREGLDIDALLGDFVTYQAVRTYLTGYRDAEYPGDDRDRTEVVAENLQRIRGRTATITESKLEQLRNAGDLALGEFRTFVEISVLCEDCGENVEVDALLEDGGCACDGPR